ncbi:MAG: 3-phosphoshikimate 1-carboxyvinyltransferase, partial [Clostridia bacterium]|nr:3-phosphoshikimate 1-carboxyvinyltransferase [Clostridia bacterium]
MKATIKPAQLSGTVKAPPSKSMAHRMLIGSGLATDGVSVIHGISGSDDVTATLACLSALGVKTEKHGDTVTVYGTDARTASANGALHCHESGSTLRFFIPICMLGETETTLTGTEKLLSRPLSVYENICREQGLPYRQTEDAVTVRGRLKAGEYRIPGNISSQFISGLLFALPLCDGDSTIAILPPVESRSYLNLTVEALADFGVVIRWLDDKTLFIKGNQHYHASEVSV